MAGLAGRLARGLLAGAAGTLAMDLLWWSRARRSGSDDAFSAWEFSSGSVTSFDDAGAPAQVGRKAASLVGMELPDEAAGTTTDVVHWLTGVGYGLGHALRDPDRPLLGGLVTGAGAFANSYATLGALGIYEPIWEYEPETLAKDLSAHLLFGATAGIVYGALSRSGSD